MRLGKRRTSIVACYRCECHGCRSIGTCGRRGDRLARGGEICRYRCEPLKSIFRSTKWVDHGPLPCDAAALGTLPGKRRAHHRFGLSSHHG